jgi:hexokinase
MLSSSYQNGPALVGAIFGTGTNGAYLEDMSKIKKLGEEFIKTQSEKTGPHMVINTEWGALDNGVSLLFLCLEKGNSWVRTGLREREGSEEGRAGVGWRWVW